MTNLSPVFLTGGTGFIGQRLLKSLLEKNFYVYLLVKKTSKEKALRLIEQFRGQEKTNVLLGDITKKNLDLGKVELNQLRKKVSYIFHLAANYDVEISQNQATLINLEGTKNVVEFALACPQLKCFSYFSTAYVCGFNQDQQKEDFLVKPTKFHNHYEWSKYKAEEYVRQLQKQLPIIIYRPTIVVGDSKTGKTERFNGPYQLISSIKKGWLWFYPGPCQVPIHIIPVDWVVAAASKISFAKKNIGKTFYLSDPRPVSVRKFIKKTAGFFDKKPPLFTLPLKLISLLPFKRLKTMILFLNQNVSFYPQNTLAALKKEKLKIPKASNYLNNLLKYYQEVTGVKDKK